VPEIEKGSMLQGIEKGGLVESELVMNWLGWGIQVLGLVGWITLIKDKNDKNNKNKNGKRFHFSFSN
jgi:hypothetical protein